MKSVHPLLVVFHAMKICRHLQGTEHKNEISWDGRIDKHFG